MTDLTELKALAEAATPGPWCCNEVLTTCGRAFRIGSGKMLAAGKGCCIIYDDYPNNTENEQKANAAFIAASREAVPVLIAEVERLQASLAEATRLMTEAAREAGEWKGRYEAAGYPDTLDGWIERAKKAEAENRKLSGLLCVIHRDGGHYIEEHGLEKALNDAHVMWGELIGRAENAQAENTKLREALSFYANPSDYVAPLTGGMGRLWLDCGEKARSALERYHD